MPNTVHEAPEQKRNPLREALLQAGVGLDLVYDVLDYVQDMAGENIKQLVQGLKTEVKLKFDAIKQSFEDVNRRFEEIERRSEDRFDQVDKRFDQVDKRFDQVDKRFDQVKERFDQVDKHAEQSDKRMEKRMDRMESEFKSQRAMLWILVVTVAIHLLVFSLTTLYAFLTGKP